MSMFDKLKSYRWRIRHIWNVIKGFIPASILCLRFPFLYPRNRFTGKHQNFWKINDLKKQVYVKYHIFELDKNMKITRNEWGSIWSEFLYKSLEFADNCLQVIFGIPYYTELDNMPTGWRKAFGVQMCKEIKEALLRAGGRKMLHKYRILDIKEKYGELRWDDNFSVPEVEKIIYKYEYISQRTCITCGRPATGYTPIEYWKSPYCDEHRPRTSKYFIEFGLKEPLENGEDNYLSDSWYGMYGYINNRDLDKYEAAKQMAKDYEASINEC